MHRNKYIIEYKRWSFAPPFFGEGVSFETPLTTYILTYEECVDVIEKTGSISQ